MSGDHHEHAGKLHVLHEAERVVLDPHATDDRIKSALEKVDALNDPVFSRAIRRTLCHEGKGRLC